MKFSTVSSLAGLLAVASANYPAVPEPQYPEHYHTQWEKVICTDPVPYTYTETVTITEYASTYPVEPTYTVTEPPYQPTSPPYIVTDGPTVTSVDYHEDKTTVWVYPTGTGSHDCTVAIYKDTIIINVVIVNIDITINNGSPVTVTSTVWDQQPTYTPTLPTTLTITDTYTSAYTPYSSGYNPSSTYTSTYSPPYPTETSSTYSSSSHSSDSSSSYSSTSTYYGTGGVYTTGYPAPTYYPPKHYPRQWFA